MDIQITISRVNEARVNEARVNDVRLYVINPINQEEELIVWLYNILILIFYVFKTMLLSKDVKL